MSGETNQIVRSEPGGSLVVGGALSTLPGASAKALVISNSLRTMARRAARVGAHGAWVEAPNRRWSPFSIGVLSSFVAVVLLPVILSGLYFGLIASEQYVSEMRFAVRGSASSNDVLSSFGGLAITQRSQDALVIADYIRSRRMFEELDKDIGLKERYGRAAVDYLSALTLSDPIEDLVRYWRWKVDVKVDKNSGVVTVIVKAFTAEDALEIARAIGERSERLANELSERSRQDSLRLAEEELARAEQLMQTSIEKMRQTRNEQGTLDASKTAEAITKVIGELRGKLMLLEGEYAVQRPTVSPTAPQMKIMTSRIENLREQIAVLEQRIAGTTGRATLTDSQGQLERRTLERAMADKQYAAAIAKFELARSEQETKQVYLMMFVPPRLAEDALFPKRFLIWSLVLGASLAIWGCGVGIAVLVRDHVAA